MKRIIIVTGACGHLGNVLIKKLLEKGEAVRGLVRSGSNTDVFNGYDVALYRGDVCDYDSLEEIFNIPNGVESVVVHTAGMVATTSESKDLVRKVNVDGTENIVKRCIAHGVKKLVYVSSVHAIEEPKNQKPISEPDDFNPKKVVGAYAKSKAEASRLVAESAKTGLDAVTVYPSGIIGPGDYGCGHTTQLVKDYLDHRLFAVVKGGYDFVDVRDVADGIISAVDNGRSGEGYILSGHYISIKGFLDILAGITGNREIKHEIPMAIAKITAPLSELYYRIKGQKPLYSIYSLYTITSNSNFSNQKAKDELGFKTRSIEESLKDMVDWTVEKL